MRTVTFSDARVADVVNKHFVSAWFNRSPGFTNADLTTERKIFAQSAEAYTTRNICTFIMTPEGRVFSYVAGYFSPELFLRFVKSAILLRDEAFDDNMLLKPGGLRAIRKLHREKFQSLTSEAAAVRPGYRPCP